METHNSVAGESSGPVGTPEEGSSNVTTEGQEPPSVVAAAQAMVDLVEMHLHHGGGYRTDFLLAHEALRAALSGQTVAPRKLTDEQREIVERLRLWGSSAATSGAAGRIMNSAADIIEGQSVAAPADAQPLSNDEQKMLGRALRRSAKIVCDPSADALDAGVVFDAGWVTAANWANRADLVSDMESPAYVQDKTNAIAALAARTLAESSHPESGREP